MSAENLLFAFAGDPKVGAGVSALLEEGGYTATDLNNADVVFTYCPNTSVLEDLYYDTEGLLRGTKEGVILVDLSPSTVTFAKELDAVACVNNRVAIDAPLVVANKVHEDAFAARSNLGIVAGSREDADYKAVKPLLDAIAHRVMWMGRAGAGQKAKVALTLQSAASLVGAVEAQVALDAIGQDVSVMTEDVLDFMGDMNEISPAQEAFAQALLDEEYDGPFAIENLMGECAAALTSLEDDELILPQAEACYRLMELLAVVGGIDYSPAALKLVFSDEETSKRYGLDWNRAEDAFGEGCGCGCEDEDHECECGHDPHEEHECCGKHHH